MNRMDDVSKEEMVEMDPWLAFDAQSMVDVMRDQHKRGLKQGVALGVVAVLLYPKVKSWVGRKLAVKRAERDAKR